ncbi:26S proteasome non-ATPase regulatory subunit 12 [Cimex lectularius]|uniref:PCI domain-containing protein n=1 Tax=Cimex lectularius TaxID=79782 RepID=A0A8I6RNJ1_CIMLE|nr:26S proteasome non-ATPase regulatory subunit 12 [Cimex lectularius]XP_014248587.1 26S proteasome non-ATPase regulatory subunit 12 [Cimex lectularius]XP_014248588.1 26S proteasome non-ATPase regulatory subunit 12 [Cimex lectularius]
MVDPAALVTDNGGKIMKMEVDYSATCDEKIAECKKMASEGKLHDALDVLISLEKQTRTGADVWSTSRVLVAIVQLCFEAKNWLALYDNIVLMSKRRSQLKQAVTKMVQQCCEYVDQMPTKDSQLKLIEVLRSVTEGKIYVEVERARLTHKLAKMKELEGNINEAANIMQELQVETYGSMSKREKVELILEQMRLCLLKKDYIRTQIIAKKINPKFFEENDTQDLKLKFYRLMIDLDQHEGLYLATCKHYRAILATPAVQDDKQQCQDVLQNVVIHLILAPYDNEQSDLAHRVLNDKTLDQLPPYKQFLQSFMTHELMEWQAFYKRYQPLLENGTNEIQAARVFKPGTELAEKSWKQLKSRVVEHNIRVMAKYYTRITLKRMSELLDMTVDETEETLSEMVVNKSVTAKTDRPAGVVTFSATQQPNDVLNDWGRNLADLMRLLNHTTHLINKEHMVHKHLLPAPSASSI